MPDLRLILQVSTPSSRSRAFSPESLDVAFVRGPLEAEGLEGVELRASNSSWSLPSHHALARRKVIPVKNLDDLPCITMERRLSPALHDAAANLYREARIRMHAVSRADNVLGHLKLGRRGSALRCCPIR